MSKKLRLPKPSTLLRSVYDKLDEHVLFHSIDDEIAMDGIKDKYGRPGQISAIRMSISRLQMDFFPEHSFYTRVIEGGRLVIGRINKEQS